MTMPSISSSALTEAGTAPLFREEGEPGLQVQKEIARLCARDHRYEDGTVFNSISSRPLPLAADVFARYLETNLGDNRIFPSLEQAERRVTRMLGEMLGHADAAGCVVSGGTEANFLAIAAAVHRFGRLRGEQPRGERPQVLVPQSIHFSFEKIAALLPIEPVRSGLDGRFRADLKDLRRRLTRRTALIVVTAGTSECGAVDDVTVAAEIAASAGVPLHVDAATGGFLIPFARELGHDLPACDFSLPGVTSITVDPHKYGWAPIPAGYLLFRDATFLEELRFESHYQGTRAQSSLLGTRPGAGVLAVYAALRHLGRQGYREIVADLFAKRDSLVRRLRRHGYELAFEPDLTIVGVRLADPVQALEYLEERGLLASVSKRHGFLRLVVQRHLDLAHYDDLIRCLNDFRRQSGEEPCASCWSRSTS